MGIQEPIWPRVPKTLCTARHCRSHTYFCSKRPLPMIICIHLLIWNIYTAPIKSPTHRRSQTSQGDGGRIGQLVEQKRVTLW